MRCDQCVGGAYTGQEPLHGPPELLPVPGVEPGPPHAAQDLGAVHGVVPHHVEGEAALLQPLAHGRGLPGGQPAVEVARGHRVHQRVEQRQEPPHHAEYLAEVSVAGQGVHGTCVQPGHSLKILFSSTK